MSAADDVECSGVGLLFFDLCLDRSSLVQIVVEVKRLPARAASGLAFTVVLNVSDCVRVRHFQ